jgi:hypothetical protein
MNVSEQHSFAQAPRAERIAQLNDQLRKTGRCGQVMLTQGVRAVEGFDAGTLVAALATYDQFDENNDPHGERDCGGLDYLGCELLWKIDYYDPALEYGSSDPADPDVTTRVLTIMLAEEY